MSPFENRFNKFLATGEYVAAEDARPKGWKPDPEKFLKNLLSQHDKRFHPNGFNPETDSCTFREQLDKTNNIDDLSAAEKRESEEKDATFKVGDKVKVIGKGLASKGWVGKIVKVDTTNKGWPYKVRFDGRDDGEYAATEIVAVEPKSAPLGDPERGRQAIIDGPGAGYLATLEREVAAGKTEGLEGEKKRCRHYIENGKDDAEKQLHRDALAFLEELGKKAKADGSAAEKKEQEENAISFKVGDKVQDPESGGFGKVTDVSGTRIRVSWDNGNATWEFAKQMSKGTPASKAYEPPFDMNKEGLYGYGKTDSDAKEAAKLAAAFNQKAGWGFSDDEVQAYFDAFKDMDAGKFPYGLPEFEGKVNEKNFNEGDFSAESKDVQKLLGVLGSRPDLIRPYIVERLEDANFHSEVKELISGAYKKRTKPYNAQKEYEERQRRQMAQDAAAVRYLKEC